MKITHTLAFVASAAASLLAVGAGAAQADTPPGLMPAVTPGDKLPVVGGPSLMPIVTPGDKLPVVGDADILPFARTTGAYGFLLPPAQTLPSAYEFMDGIHSIVNELRR
ncbi:hypothetical protein Sros01_03810 [Streptomyces roseochromogenus]|nr:hypothetical protein Sros01_03810 [Streptomyces roseochromogenus]